MNSWRFVVLANSILPENKKSLNHLLYFHCITFTYALHIIPKIKNSRRFLESALEIGLTNDAVSLMITNAQEMKFESIALSETVPPIDIYNYRALLKFASDHIIE